MVERARCPRKVDCPVYLELSDVDYEAFRLNPEETKIIAEDALEKGRLSSEELPDAINKETIFCVDSVNAEAFEAILLTRLGLIVSGRTNRKDICDIKKVPLDVMHLNPPQE